MSSDLLQVFVELGKLGKRDIFRIVQEDFPCHRTVIKIPKQVTTTTTTNQQDK